MPDLLTTFSFHVELDGIDIGAFKEASGVDSETEIVEYKETTKDGKMIIRKLPGAMKWSDITLKKRIDSKKDLWDWRKEVEQGDIDNARRNGSIVLYDSTAKEVARWNFMNGWPSKWKGADLNAGENAVAVEEITITHEGLERG
ncbi:MAG TPA: phage tail protein [Actinomycetota bacterium]|nr:phage tail protein [Actinomycetota bacterium]